MKQITYTLLFFLISLQSICQVSNFGTPVSINTTGNDSHPSAIMDVDVDDKGILIPRLSTINISNIANPATGLLVYDSVENVFKYYDGTSWQPMVSTTAGLNGAGDILVTNNNGIYTISYTDADKDNTNEVQFISKNGNVISLSAIDGIGGGTVTLDDNDPTNEIQNLIYNYSNNRLTISDNNNTNVIDLSSLATDNQNLTSAVLDSNSKELSINIEDGNSADVDLSSLDESVVGSNDITVSENDGVYTVDYNDADKSNTNESQSLTKNGANINLSMANGAGGGIIALNDDDASNEIQELTYDMSSQTLGISNNANSTTVDLSVFDESVAGANDISVTESNGIYTVDYIDGDKSDTNESQTLSKSGADISLTMANGAGGGTITLNDDSFSNEIQDLTYDAPSNVLKITNNGAATDIDLTELEESVTGTNDISVTETNGVYTVDYTDGDQSNTNEAQFIFKQNSTVTMSPANNVGGGSFTLDDDDATNELQDLSYDVTTNILKVTNNGSATDINLTELEESVTGTNDIAVTESNGVYTVDYIDGDKSNINESQSLTKSGSDITLSMANGAGGGIVTLNDDNATNEIQDLNYDASTNILKVTNNGSATDIDLTELEESVTGTNDITVTESNGLYTVDYSDGDKSDTNEAQSLSKNGSTISLSQANMSGGGDVTLNDDDASNEIQDLSYDAMSKILKVTNNNAATDIDLSGLQDNLGNHSATADVSLNSKTLKLKDSAGTMNGVRYAGPSSKFNNYDPNGAVIYGEDGGVLGTTKNQEKVVLSWSDDGRVGINTTDPANALDVNGHISLSESTGDEMVIKNANTWTHSSGSQDMNYGSAGGDHFIIGSKEGSVEGSGIYGDGDHMTIWVSGEDIETPNAYMYILDTDKMDADNDPYDNNAVVAYLGVDGNWVAPSDVNRKENIQPLESSLEKILSINGYSYDFKRTQSEIERGMQAPHALGVIAQEVAEVIPEVVEIKSNGEHFVSYTEFIPLLIESIKEQQVQIDQLTTELNALKENK